MNYKVTQVIDGTKYETLRDILPEKGELKILFVGKTPSVKSVMIGHYFLGVRGKNFWKKLNEYGILKFPQGEYGDDWLLKNDYGITHVSKIPHEFKNPTREDYIKGYKTLMEKIDRYKPKLIVFSYKNALDSILSFALNEKIKTNYGFNPECDRFFHSAVFVFPMSGTPCTKAEMLMSLDDLMSFLKHEDIIK